MGKKAAKSRNSVSVSPNETVHVDVTLTGLGALNWLYLTRYYKFENQEDVLRTLMRILLEATISADEARPLRVMKKIAPYGTEQSVELIEYLGLEKRT